MSSFELLGGLDVQLYHWDTPATPMNMGNVCLWEGAPLLDSNGRVRIDEIRRVIAAHLHHVPRYRRKIMQFPGSVLNPILVDDPDFDIAEHIVAETLPPPGTIEQVKEVFARIHEGRLDRSRPPWKIVFVDGLEDGRVAMVQKIHHTPFDGATTVRIMQQLFDERPDAPAADPPPWNPQPPPRTSELIAAVLRDQAIAAIKLHTGPHSPWFRLGGPAELARTLLALKHFGPAPTTSLNGPVGPRRRFDWIHSTIDEARQLRALVPGAKLNDVMLAVVSGGMRDLFLARGEDVTRIRPRVFVPVDVRDDEGEPAPGNQVSAMVAVLPIHELDPVRRLRGITDQMIALKASRQAQSMRLLMETSSFTPPTLMAAAGFLAQKAMFMNLTVTNVPGPPHDLYLLGAKMLELNPMLPIGTGLTLNVAVESYAGNLSIGVCCDPDAVPDLDVFTRGLAAALNELRQLAGC